MRARQHEGLGETHLAFPTDLEFPESPEIGQLNTARYAIPCSKGNRGRNRRLSPVNSYDPNIGGCSSPAADTTRTAKTRGHSASCGWSFRNSLAIPDGKPRTSKHARGVLSGASTRVGFPLGSAAFAMLQTSAAASQRRHSCARTLIRRESRDVAMGLTDALSLDTSQTRGAKKRRGETLPNSKRLAADAAKMGGARARRLKSATAAGASAGQPFRLVRSARSRSRRRVDQAA